jgi:ABC-type transport system involved in multi-copper enzyme maturation permease subunit
MARTDTEIYRRFRGTIRPGRTGFLALARAGIASAGRKKLPLVILFAPPAIATVIFGFVVYARFSLQAGVTPSALGPPSPAAAIASTMAKTLIQVRDQIVLFHLAMNVFTLLVIAWFGAGLIAEDRRSGAHLLYFSRPLTPRGYLAAKFLTLLAYALAAVLVPNLLICLVATLASPEWSFLKEEGSVVPLSILFACLWAGVWSSVMLAISSLFRRKTFALVASFAGFMITGAISVILANLQNDDRWLQISLQGSFQLIAGWMFEARFLREVEDPTWSFLGIGLVTALSWTVLFFQVRRMEAAV